MCKEMLIICFFYLVIILLFYCIHLFALYLYFKLYLYIIFVINVTVIITICVTSILFLNKSLILENLQKYTVTISNKYGIFIFGCISSRLSAPVHLSLLITVHKLSLCFQLSTGKVKGQHQVQVSAPGAGRGPRT